MRNSPTWDLNKEGTLKSVLSHYLNKHPRSDGLIDVIDGTYAKRACSGCQSEFEAQCSVGYESNDKPRINAEAYCPDCANERPINEIMVVELTPQEYVKQEVV